MILRAKEEGDYKTLEFLLNKIPDDVIPLLFGYHEWVNKAIEWHDRQLNDKCLIDRLFYGMKDYKSEYEFDYLFELYVNEKFSLPEHKKQRLALFHY